MADVKRIAMLLEWRRFKAIPPLQAGFTAGFFRCEATGGTFAVVPFLGMPRAGGSVHCPTCKAFHDIVASKELLQGDDLETLMEPDASGGWRVSVQLRRSRP